MKLLKVFIIAALFSAGLIGMSMAGHYHHGYGMKMSAMSDLDTNRDGSISFEEFNAPNTEKMKKAFKMLDTDSDNVISEAEWDDFLRVHGYGSTSEG